MGKSSASVLRSVGSGCGNEESGVLMVINGGNVVGVSKVIQW